MKQKQPLLYPLLVCLTILVNQAAAQYTLTGKLIDDKNFPTGFANLLLTDHATGRTLSTVTDTQGIFYFTGLKGLYSLDIKMLGFEPMSLLYNIISDTNSGAIRLKTNLKVLSEVVVTAKTPQVKRTSDRYIIAVNNSPVLITKTMDEILPYLPGVQSSETGISINGMSGVAIFVNGKQLRFSGQELQSYLKSIPASDIKSIEILPHPPSNYDAAGLGGIIEIITQNAIGKGIAGYIGTTYKQGRYAADNLNGSLSYKTGKLLIYGNGSWDISKIYFDRLSQKGSENSSIFYDSKEFYKRKDKAYSYKLGADIDITSRHFIGLEFNQSQSLTRSLPGSLQTSIVSNGKIDSTLNSVVYDDRDSRMSSANLYYSFLIDTTGKKLIFTSDYSNYTYNTTNRNDNCFYTVTNLPLSNNSKQSMINRNVDVYSGKIDFNTPIGNSKWESGFKYSYVKTGNLNDFRKFDSSNKSYLPDMLFTNDFTYHEKDAAFYSSFSSKHKKLEYTAGIRFENTTINTFLNTKKERHDTSYLNFFPSLFLKYPLSTTAKHSLLFYVGRRIQRPEYRQLNPFVYYIDEFTFKTGNPNLYPAYTYAYELTYSLKDKYYFSFNCYDTRNQMGDVETRIGDSTFISFKNLNNQKNISANIYAPLQIYSWWTSVNQLQFLYYWYNDGGYNAKQAKVDFSTINTFQITPTTILECNLNLITRGIDRFYIDDKNYWNANIAASQRLFKRKLQVSIGVNDIFNSLGTTKTSTNYDGQYNHYVIQRQSRLFYLGVKYYFRKGINVNRANKEVSNSEEKSRIR